MPMSGNMAVTSVLWCFRCDRTP